MRRFLLLTLTLVGVLLLEAHADAEGYREGYAEGRAASKTDLDAQVFRQGWAAATATAKAAQEVRIHDLAEQVMPDRKGATS